MEPIYPIGVPASGFLDPKDLLRKRELLKEAEESHIHGLEAYETALYVLIFLAGVLLGIIVIGIIPWCAVFILIGEVYLVIRLCKFVEKIVLRRRNELRDRYREGYKTIDELLGRGELIFAANEPRYFEHVLPLLNRAR